MRRTAFVTTAIIFALTACTSVANDSPASAVTDGPEATVADALSLGTRAETANDVEALSMAAGLLRSAGAHPSDGTSDLAERWAALAIEQGAEVSFVRGRMAGPAYREDLLGGGEELTLREVFHAGRTAVIVLRPRDDGQFRLTATNGDTVVCTVEANAVPAECRWTPIWTEPVDVRVTNLGPREASYFLVTN